ncbi:ComF family protein [Teichococcus oryzae]|uniref:ComF family protein n=1 Tax=Teichococcus oryzae TaxID=1608942 RepID=A0A5B2TAB4_9PROT|nr:ComF family protein [Pseudoroseomonas oryzae]KAA2211517.1 ComF family protein [Pseudoroseomonas oryzae]
MVNALGGLRKLHGFGRVALDALLLPRCVACGEVSLSHGAACPDCFAALTPLSEPQCRCCGTPFLHEGQAAGMDDAGKAWCGRCAEEPPIYGQARAAYLYDDGSKRLLLPFKHGDRTELALPLARQMARAGRELLDHADLLLPVPLHRRRLMHRRYNQAALLARQLSRLSGIPWAPNLLLRPRRTPPLGPLGALARAEVLRGAFALAARDRPRIDGRRILLVDDVLTSGATVSACTAVLLEAGARSVDVLAVARVADPRLVEAP